MKLLEFALYYSIFLAAHVKCFAISKFHLQDICAIYIFLMSILYIIYNLKYLENNSIIASILIYFFTLLIPIINTLNITTFTDFTNSLVFPLLFITSYIFIIKDQTRYKQFKYIGLFTIVFSLLNLLRLSEAINLEASRPMQSNAGNTLVSLLPFVFLWKNKIIKYSLLALIFVGCLIAIKRSAFIIFVLVLVFYFTFNDSRENGKCWMKLFKYLSGIIVSITLILLNSKLGQQMYFRLEGTGEDGGSGRTHLIEYGFALLSKNDFSDWILGNGFRSFSYSMFHIYQRRFTCAHNDFIEILYAAGIFAFISFIALLRNFFIYTRKLYYNINPNTVTFMCCFIIFFCASVLVCTYVHYWYYLPMYCLFGATLAVTIK